MDSSYLKTLYEDNEQISEIKNIKEILKDEDLIFSLQVTKIKGEIEEDRIIVLSNKHLYNFKAKKYRTKIAIKNIIGITIGKKSYEFVIHTCEQEYDSQYSSEKRTQIIELIARIYFCLTKKKIALSVVDHTVLDRYVTKKSDKKSNSGTTKFDPSFFMDVDHYLYGNIKKPNSKTLASVTKFLRSEIVFFNPITCNNLDLKKLRIENFRHLEVLSLSVYGDVVLAEYIPTGMIYFIRTVNSSDSNEFCHSFDLLMDINMSMDFPFMAVLDILLKTQTQTYLITSFKDNFEGGYLISKVYDCGIFSEENALFFGAQIALIIDYFHKKNISFLGFSPQNFLIGQDGYIKYVDYEMDYNTVQKHKEKICIYEGPEEYNLIMNDWYNFGVIMYEMLFGIQPSFKNEKLFFPKYFVVSEKGKNFLENIFRKEVYEEYDLDKVKNDEFFGRINFEEILGKKANAKLRFLTEVAEVPQLPVFPGMEVNTEPPYNILNFNSIDLEINP